MSNAVHFRLHQVLDGPPARSEPISRTDGDCKLGYMDAQIPDHFFTIVGAAGVAKESEAGLKLRGFLHMHEMCAANTFADPSPTYWYSFNQYSSRIDYICTHVGLFSQDNSHTCCVGTILGGRLQMIKTAYQTDHSPVSAVIDCWLIFQDK